MGDKSGEAVDTMAAAVDARQPEGDGAVPELRRPEDRYRLLFDLNPHSMWVYDLATLEFLEVNQAAIGIYGYSRAEFLRMRITDIRPIDDLPRLTARMASRREPRTRSAGWRHRLKSGAIIVVEITSHTLTFDGRRAALVVAQDVTARTNMEAALHERTSLTALTADVAVALNRPQPLRKCLVDGARAAVARLDLAGVHVWTTNQTGVFLVLEGSAGTYTPPDATDRGVAIGEGAIGRVGRNGLPYFSAEGEDDGGVDDQEGASREGIVAFAAYPLLVGPRVVGVMAIFASRVLSDAILTGVAAVADLIALGIERHRGDDARRLLASIVEGSDDAIFSKTLDGTIVSWNAGAERLYGYAASEAVGRHASLLAPENRAQEPVTLLNRVITGVHVNQYETVRLHKNGSLLPVSLTLSPIKDAAGQIRAASVIARDISHVQRAAQTLRESEERLRDAEERMRFALDAARVGVWEVNLSTHVGYWSGACEQMHGAEPGRFKNTLDALAAIHPDDRQRVLDATAEATAAHTNTDLEYRAVWPDGTVHRISSVGHFFYDASGVAVRGGGVAIDVTERHLLEEQLRQSQKMDAIGQLAGGIAHDFNNLLTAILGFAGILADSIPESDARRADVEEIRLAADRAAALTRQLLAFSRKQILAMRVLHLGDVVADLTPMLRRLLGEAIDLRTTIGERGLVKADPGQIEQVIVNLGVNAHDAMRHGGRLTIETADVVLDEAFRRHHPSVRPGPHVMLTVSDSGHGMDAATRKRVFEPFFTTKPQGQGTGLGLATVYGIVKQSGGSIWMTSEIGQGTTFKIYLPRTDELEEVKAPAAKAAAARGGTETILLVEDEDLVRAYVQRVLTAKGYTVHAMSDPARALEFAETWQGTIDLVFTDVVLPEMSGRAMIAQLHQRHQGAKVLYMSGYDDHAIVHRGVLESGTAFLPKPFTADALARKIREVLDGQ